MEDMKIKHLLEKITETDEEVLFRLSFTVMGEHREIWFTEKKE